MSFLEEITVMKARIAKAASQRDGWRAAGRQEKYLEAYLMVEALELQLERLRMSRGQGQAVTHTTRDPVASGLNRVRSRR